MRRTEFKNTTEARQRALFYKCPVGGFASLAPGRCPKCDKQLSAFSSSEDAEIEDQDAVKKDSLSLKTA
ncbi:MAG: hypothetical protein M3458_16765 [Acidobacteriota bacterium]|nr:hypothetical protein [Acidobacteriota bacterium]